MRFGNVGTSYCNKTSEASSAANANIQSLSAHRRGLHIKRCRSLLNFFFFSSRRTSPPSAANAAINNPRYQFPPSLFGFDARAASFCQPPPFVDSHQHFNRVVLRYSAPSLHQCTFTRFYCRRRSRAGTGPFPVLGSVVPPQQTTDNESSLLAGGWDWIRQALKTAF